MRQEYIIKRFHNTSSTNQADCLCELSGQHWRLVSVVPMGSDVIMYFCRDIQSKTIVKSILNFDFDALYKIYPRKEGKSVGLRTFNAQIKTQEDYDLLLKAIKNYNHSIVVNKKDPKFFLMFSTFMNQWRDWTDASTGTVNVPAPPKKPLPAAPEAPKIKVSQEFIGNIIRGIGKK